MTNIKEVRKEEEGRKENIILQQLLLIHNNEIKSLIISSENRIKANTY